MRKFLFTLALLGAVTLNGPAAEAESADLNQSGSPSSSTSQIGDAFTGCISSAIKNQEMEQVSSPGYATIQLSCRGVTARKLYQALIATHPEGDYNKSGYFGKITRSRAAVCVHVLEHDRQSKDEVLCNIILDISK
jgi:hypothetical protein